MKPFVALIVFPALAVILIPWLHLQAYAGPVHKVIFVVGQKAYLTDGQSKSMDTAPFIENSRTYVPVRFMAYALGVPEEGVEYQNGAVVLNVPVDTAHGHTVKMEIGSATLSVDGHTVQMDVAPLLRNDRTFLPARWLAEAVDYEVKWDEASQSVLIGPPGSLPEPSPVDNDAWATKQERKEVEISTGTKSISLVRVNMKDPTVELKVVTAMDKIGKVEELSSMADRVGAVAAINGTFFNAYDSEDLLPQGTLGADHHYYHLGGGATVGIDDQNKLFIGNLTPGIEGSTDGSWEWPNWWYAWGLNHPYAEGIEVFTPEYKDGMTPPGRTAVVVRNGVVTEISSGQVAIPPDGYVIWYGKNNSEKAGPFLVGKKVDYKVVFSENPQIRFKTALSNSPLLLSGGETALGDVSDPKLMIGAPRSFTGVTWDNVLVMGTVDSANIWELAEITRALGLKEALNLDGGASCGLYYNGQYVRQPGRLLSNCLAVIKH